MMYYIYVYVYVYIHMILYHLELYAHIPWLYNFTIHFPLPEEAQFLEALDLSVRALGGERRPGISWWFFWWFNGDLVEFNGL